MGGGRSGAGDGGWGWGVGRHDRLLSTDSLLVSSMSISGMDRDVHSLMLSIQHFRLGVLTRICMRKCNYRALFIKRQHC